jgi:hypothetical protein
MINTLVAFFVALAFAGGQASAQTSMPTATPTATAVASVSPAPADARELIARMLARNPSLNSYKARVHVDLHMLNFPFLAPVLEGTSYFKRPDNYEVVFDRVPGYAKGFEKIFNDVADPQHWQNDQNVDLRGTQVVDGRRYYVLYLTKKVHSDIIDHATAFVDPATYELTRMEWHYTDGGKIVMTQQYQRQGDYSFVTSQHVTIDMPRIHVRAVGDSQYGIYQTNVAVNDSVFSKKS